MKRAGVIVALVFGLCIVGTGLPVCAQTIDFNITVTKDGNSPDPLSRRTTKADGEQRFYATATGCWKGNGVVRAYSKSIDDGVNSNSLVISSYNIGIRQSATYRTNAKEGTWYYMDTHWDSGTTDTINLVGRYTP